MHRLIDRVLLMGLIASTLPLGACSQNDSHAAHGEGPAQVEKIEGSSLSRVTLTEKAMERIALETVAVEERDLNGSTRQVVPYSSLIYDSSGNTWIYTSPQPRTFVRLQVVVDRIEDGWVYLSDGPAAGTTVASVGVAELYGSETGVGH